MEPQNQISVPLEQSEYTRQIDALPRQVVELTAKLEASELARECAYRQGTEDAHQCQQRHAHIDGLEKQVKDLQAQLSAAQVQQLRGLNGASTDAITVW